MLPRLLWKRNVSVAVPLLAAAIHISRSKPLSFCPRFSHFVASQINPFTADPVKVTICHPCRSNPPFLIFWHSGAMVLSPERQSARMSKIKNGGLNQYGAKPFEQQQFRTPGVERVKMFFFFESKSTVSLDAIVCSLQAIRNHALSQKRPGTAIYMPPTGLTANNPELMRSVRVMQNNANTCFQSARPWSVTGPRDRTQIAYTVCTTLYLGCDLSLDCA